MPIQLLKTKLYIPPLRSELVPRPHLIERLHEGLNRKLTLISAPAGFGKTTLLSAWVNQNTQSPKFAWLSLDEQDSEVVRFWTYLIAALQTVQADLGQGALKLLQSPQPLSAQAILTPLLNEIAALAQDIVLVLDDYHLISAPSIHEGMAFVLEHQPRNLHLVIATRADPPLPTFRLRARGQLTELRSDDLRFTPGEAATFLNTLMGLNLATEDVQALEARTEGWIVGLQLAALSLQGRADAHAFISAFSGSHHYVLEYLTEEVVRRQPEPVQRFLMQTSILDRLCGPLCDTVLGEKNGQWLVDRDSSASDHDPLTTCHSQTMLAHLHRRNLFIVPLDDERRWYRYHHLFADLLGNILRQALSPESVCALHRHASEWHEQHGSLDDAVKHALQAGGSKRAARLIEQAARTTMLHGGLNKLLRWLEALPEELLRARPRLRLYQGWALHLSGRSDVAERILQEAKKALPSLPPSPDNVALRGELAALLAGVATLREDTATVIQEAQEALTYLPDEDQISRARVYIALGTAYAYDDEAEKATQAWRQARELALEAGNLFLATGAIEMLAGMQIYHQGRLREGAQTLRQVLDLGTTQDGSRLPFTGTAHALLAEIYLEWNDLDAAASYLKTGIELLQRGGIGYGLTHTYCAKARLEQAVGDAQGALEALQTARRATEACPLWHIIIHQASRQVRLALWLGDVETAARWATGDPLNIKREISENLPLYLREVQQIALARVHLARGETEKALATLDRWHAQAQAAGRMAQVLEICLVKALALQAQGDSAAALESLAQSLSLAEVEGYVRLFVEAGEPMAALLRRAVSRGIAPGYAGKLLAACDASGQGRAEAAPAHSQAQPLVEPLTRRELEVLQWICEGLANQEIAERLVVTLNTVKKHASNVYGKLGVNSRAQAIIRARELGLC